MKKIREKLNSNAGASILIALLFFAICCVVSVSVLMLAKANTDQMRNHREMEQAFLSVNSAVDVFETELHQPQPPFAVKTVVEDKVSDEVSVSWRETGRKPEVTYFVTDEMLKMLRKESDEGIALADPRKISFAFSTAKQEFPEIQGESLLTHRSESTFALEIAFSKKAQTDMPYHMNYTVEGILEEVQTDRQVTTDKDGEVIRITTTYDVSMKWGQSLRSQESKKG